MSSENYITPRQRESDGQIAVGMGSIGGLIGSTGVKYALEIDNTWLEATALVPSVLITLSGLLLVGAGVHEIYQGRYRQRGVELNPPTAIITKEINTPRLRLVPPLSSKDSGLIPSPTDDDPGVA